jgi:sec-independent protein translocase protein TatA
MSWPGGLEMIIIAFAVLLLFGAKKIPELARGLGQGISEFRKATSEIKKEIEKGETAPDKSKDSTPAKENTTA